jgi:hypothetical protein
MHHYQLIRPVHRDTSQMTLNHLTIDDILNKRKCKIKEVICEYRNGQKQLYKIIEENGEYLIPLTPDEKPAWLGYSADNYIDLSKQRTIFDNKPTVGILSEIIDEMLYLLQQ